jgi:peptidoglycan/xylan/chitin deacetylase (PgdA/CDA1 family)
MFEYGSRVGSWRVMRIFQERGLPLTVFGCALALERSPPAAAALVKAGFDICSHGWRWVKHYGPEEERRHIQQAVQSLAATTGQRPLGWYCRYGPSVNTRRLLVEEGTARRPGRPPGSSAQKLGTVQAGLSLTRYLSLVMVRSVSWRSAMFCATFTSTSVPGRAGMKKISG